MAAEKKGCAGLEQNFRNRDFYQEKAKKKPRIISYLALIVCVFALIGMYAYQKEIGPFAQSTLAHPKVSDSRSKKEAQRDFDQLLDQIFKEEVTDNTITLNYTLKNKSSYGIDSDKVTLGEYSLDEMKNSLLVSENRVATLETFDYDKLSKEQKLIYDIIYLMSKQNLEAADFLGKSGAYDGDSGAASYLFCRI